MQRILLSIIDNIRFQTNILMHTGTESVLRLGLFVRGMCCVIYCLQIKIEETISV